MGLDQYLFTQENEGEEATEAFYWRKHPDLHGFFAREWVAINPNKEETDFNCETLYLTTEILERLEKALLPSGNESLPKTQGFFFGHSDGYYADQDLKALEFAKGALRKGHKVFYTSWW
jgi:hypothetical protein